MKLIFSTISFDAAQQKKTDNNEILQGKQENSLSLKQILLYFNSWDDKCHKKTHRFADEFCMYYNIIYITSHTTNNIQAGSHPQADAGFNCSR
jgi:hypothetical protein